MRIHEQADALTIIGIELRTSNTEAMRTIPPFWQRFQQSDVLARLPHRVSADLYAVYTHFAHAGRDNGGLYSLVIGAAVPPEAEVPPGLVRVVAPAGRRAVFEVETGRFDTVGETWAAIWQHTDLPKCYIADYERYRAEGGIEICVGLHPAGAIA